ncbi:hypothetical protein [Pedobacter psychrodurus]|uniref:hypothetical protein n=1 Tax=Pedobacter psychrodurus TaxID=2530456 RepID=UPI0019819058|nr:hypothetical protein [Pedobacter psychrodurus]
MDAVAIVICIPQVFSPLNPGLINTTFGRPIEVEGLVADDLEMLKKKFFNTILEMLVA